MMVALAACLVSWLALTGCGKPAASPSSSPAGRVTREPTPASPASARDPAHLLPSDAPVPASPELFKPTNAWIVSDEATLLEVCAGAAGNDPHTGRFWIVRQNNHTGQQRLDVVDVPYAGALRIVDPPSGSAVETSAQRGMLSFVGRSGIKGELDLSTDRVTRTWVPPAAVTVGVATLRYPPTYTWLFAATGQRAYVVVLPAADWPKSRAIRVIEIAGDGRVVKQRSLVVGPVYAQDIMDVSAGPDGLYIGTTVLRRFFPHVPDELLRIDPTTLAIVATTKFSAGVGAVEQGQQLWAAIDDGRVARLDPGTLKVLASRRVVPKPTPVSAAMIWVSTPAIGAGSVWVLASDEHQHLDLVRLDPTTLAVRSRTPVHGKGSSISAEDTISYVAAGSRGVYLWGEESIVRVNAHGAVEGKPISEPNLGSLAVDGSTPIALVGPPAALVELDPQGRLLARTPLPVGASELTVSGRDAWFVEYVKGERFVHVRLNLP